MNTYRTESKRAFIKWIIIIVIAIGILSYFGFDLKNIFESDIAKRNFGWLWNGILYVWNNFLATPVLWVWNNVLVDILSIAWKAFKIGLETIKNMGNSVGAN